jgi:hydroxymethylpyrimidine pyrophosphatase-like HAD family hydrolase
MTSGYDKGTAIDALSAYYTVEKSNIMAIGDDYNDIPMLQEAGISVAVENAVPEAKAVARYITDTNNNDGVAKIIKRLVFHEE